MELGGVVGDAPQLCTIGRIFNRCTGCVAMATLEIRGRAHAVIRQAHRSPHALRMPAKTPLTSDKIDAPAACATLSATTPFRFVHTAGGVVTRTRNVSEYMLVLVLCLVENQ